jgi:16S rRNA (guanine966-N2)-methyltransferase
MKIIAGTLKGKKILTYKDYSYKPITSMLKESIFGVLSSGQFINSETDTSILQDATSIDAFGGTGAFTFEAISRGVAKSVVIEKDLKSVDALRRNTESLGIANKVTIIRGDALNLPRAATECSIAFIDPPFKRALVYGCVKSLVEKNWLAKGAILIIRTHIKDPYDINEFCHQIFKRKYGNSLLSIYRY